VLSCGEDVNDINQETTSENLTATIAYNQINGVDLNLLSLDIYYNSDLKTQKPVVVYVHGGAWTIGDKSNEIVNKVSLFQSLDYVFVSVNYRLSPFPFELDNLDRIMFPTHNNDVADAIKWVYDSIDQYGGNPEKIALLDLSAGAHLVSLTATNTSFLENVGLTNTVLKGVATIDTEGYNVLAKAQENNEIFENAFGTNLELNTQASPTRSIENDNFYPNFFVAKRGNPLRIAIADDFIEALEQNNTAVSQIDGSIYTHNEINSAIGDPNDNLITIPLVAFFEACFE